ncbi:hypothetical protein [uncultured Thiodictyon sp.]|uniref:hypothetical protein n=1 Tax=uncultured Thiodictyon sp. TaxID=1846217 RepID=UPI0025F8D3A7|nr:hypothetical protein [uncultured Thiodictyon sp.]
MIQSGGHDLNSYREALLWNLEPHRRHLATPAVSQYLMMKSIPPGRARGCVEQVTVEMAREELRGLVGKIPSSEIAKREVALNLLASRLGG